MADRFQIMSVNHDNKGNLSSTHPPALPARVQSSRQGRHDTTLPFIHSNTPDSGVSFGSQDTEYDIPKPVTTGKCKDKLSARVQKAQRGLQATFKTRSGPLMFEFLATASLYLIGFSGSLSAMVSPGVGVIMAPLAWGLAVMFAMLWSIQFSGAHLNPGVSIMLAAYGRFSWRKVLPYSLAQLCGAVLGTGLAFCLQFQRLSAHLGDISPSQSSNSLADLIVSSGVLYTKPNVHITPPVALLSELLASFALGFTIMVLEKVLPRKSSMYLAPPIMGAYIAVLATGFGTNTAACLSPIRDLAPRIVAAMVGGKEGWKVFAVNKASAYGWWLWGPFGADIVGILMGAGCFILSYKLYTWNAGQNAEEEEEEEEEGMSVDVEKAGDWDYEVKEQGMVKRYKLVEQFGRVE